MPSIQTASTAVTSFPNMFSSPYGNDEIVPLYSSVPLKSPVAGCLPCVVCGNSIVRQEVISNASPSLSNASGVVITPTGGVSFSSGVLYFILPCTSGCYGNLCNTNYDYHSSGTIISERTGNFLVTFRVRGVIETTPPDAWTNQGTTIAPYVQKNPSGYASGNNVYSFIVGSDTYVLNWGTWDGNLTVLDYTFQVEIPSGGTYTLDANSVDHTQTCNFANLVASNDDPQNPIEVSQPYNGQFMQMNLESWVYLG